MQYALKTPIPQGEALTFTAQKTMYGGKKITAGDTIYLFDSENEGGSGLVARALVTHAAPVPPKPGLPRQTPRVTITIRRTAPATRPIGRAQLKPFTTWDDGRPETELNFKLYRQATNKIIGLTPQTAAYLAACCAPLTPEPSR